MSTPDRIGPDVARKRSIGDLARRAKKTFTTKYVRPLMIYIKTVAYTNWLSREGLIGSYDYGFLFRVQSSSCSFIQTY